MTELDSHDLTQIVGGNKPDCYSLDLSRWGVPFSISIGTCMYTDVT